MASNPSQENEITTANEAGFLNVSRHEHNLYSNEGLGRYTCSGCEQFGINIGFKCRSGSCLEFVLHRHCAVLLDQCEHPSFPERPNTTSRHHCDGCGEVLRGFLFQSNGRPTLRLHPMCMALPPEFRHSGHPEHDLELITVKEKYKCIRCSEENLKWKYQCRMVRCGVKLDMNCAMLDIHHVSGNGNNHAQSPSKLKRVEKMCGSAGRFIAAVVSGVVQAVVVSGVVQAVVTYFLYEVLNDCVGEGEDEGENEGEGGGEDGGEDEGENEGEGGGEDEGENEGEGRRGDEEEEAGRNELTRP